MFKKLRLTFHLFILYGLFASFLLLLCGYCLFVIHDYEGTVRAVDQEQLPLGRAIAEISRHQLDQVLRFNEVLLFARVSDREKFEISNEGYVQAGKRMGDDILEGRNIAQKGIDAATYESRLKEFDTIKTLLKGIEKAHGDYEHLGALLIRGIYQYDFLLKNEYFASGDHVAAEAEATKHVTFMNATLSAMEDETRRLENGIKEAMERVKQLSQTLASDAKQQKERVFNRVLPLLFFALSSGLLLVFAITRVQKNREHSKNQLMDQSLLTLSDVLAQLQSAFQVLEPSSQQLEKNFSLQRDSFGDTVASLRDMMRLSEGQLQLSLQNQSLATAKKNLLEQTNLLVQQLNKDAGSMLEFGLETGKIIRKLRESMIQVNVMATNASAEALRLEATRSFSVFTEEIKELSRSTALVSETVSGRMDDAIKGIRADHLHASQTYEKFLEVVGLAGKENLLLEEATATTQDQAVLLRKLQSMTTEVDLALQASGPLMDQMKTARNTAQSKVGIALDTIEKITKGSRLALMQEPSNKEYDSKR